MSNKKETAAFVCGHIFRMESVILLVSKQGGDWQFLCGAGHEAGELPKVVGLNHLINRDASLNELLDLPDNWEAERENSVSPWKRRPTET